MLFSWRKYNQRLPMIQQRTSQLRRFGSKEIKLPLNNNEGSHLTDIQKLQDQLTNLQSTLQSLTYQIHQSQSATLQTQALARRSEARAYIIEQKLMDIQSHIVQIPPSLKAVENIAHTVSERAESKMRGYISQLPDSFRGKELFSNKYIAWSALAALILFYQYRVRVYQRTSEEVANVAALTLQQDSLRQTIQETLRTVAESPETLESLSLLFQRLIREEKTEQHLIDLIVRALNSEGVKLAVLQLLELCFQNESLQIKGGDFLKIAAKNAVLDEGVQISAGVGIQKALKSVVMSGVPWSRKKEVEVHSVTEDGEDEIAADCTDDGDAESTTLSSSDEIIANSNWNGVSRWERWIPKMLRWS
jgi:hypothetical protein